MILNNGNNLLHLFAASKSNDKDTASIIEDLINAGLDPNEPNNEGKNFLQVAVDNNRTGLIFQCLYHPKKIKEIIDFNHKDNKGRTLMHNIAYMTNLADILYSFGDISWILHWMLEQGYSEIKTSETEEDVFKIMYNRVPKMVDDFRKQTKHDDIEIKTYVFYDHIYHLNGEYYRANISQVTSKFNDDVEHNKKIVEEIFDKYSYEEKLSEKIDPIYLCQKNNELNDDNLLATKRFLKMGYNPNYYTCFEHVLEQNCSLEYLLSLIKIFIEHGLDINSDTKLMKNVIEHFGIERSIDVYTFISKYGYSILKDDINYYYTCFKNTEDSDLKIIESYQSYQFIRTAGFVKML